jgi:hypothetical protein
VPLFSPTTSKAETAATVISNFNANNAQVIDILQQKIHVQIEPTADEEARQQELKTIELICTYLRNFKVLLIDKIQN